MNKMLSMENIISYIRQTGFDKFPGIAAPEDILYADIETTGLSPASAFIYCIGMAYYAEGKACLHLAFGESREDEPEVLRTFCDILGSRDHIVTFNGTTFDIPFIRKRCERYNIPDPFINKEYTDLYREAKRLKKFLNLKSYSQKSIEHFLGCCREDEMGGGELIPVYYRYERFRDPDDKRLLVLHNLDDVKGMLKLSDIMSYRLFLDGNVSFSFAELSKDRDTLCFVFKTDYPFPKPVRARFDFADILLEENKAVIKLPVYTGNLRHYFPDYKNYYYLPDEGTIIHKSLGEFVDRDHRENAVKENCFLEKTCSYIQLPGSKKDSYLKKGLKDKTLYIELPEDVNDEDFKQSILREVFNLIR